ncbi:MAG: GntR family transcriptional regulator [Saccharofermentanales bacterium]
MKLDKHSNIPLYYQLKEKIVENIETGVFEPGSKISSEILLCDQLGLSRPTVRQAIAELVSEGKLQIIKGKGTFVVPSYERKVIKNFSGAAFSFFASQKLDKKEIEDYMIVKEVSKEIEDAFDQLSFNQEGYVCIKRILQDGSRAYAYVESYIPVALFPNLCDDIKNDKAMIDITVNKYAYLPIKNTCSLIVRPSNSVEARALDISRGTPVMNTLSRMISRSEVVSEVVVATLRADICQLQF